MEVGDVGCVVWDVVFVFLKYLEILDFKNGEFLKGKEILEFGVGIGCVGFVVVNMGWL